MRILIAAPVCNRAWILREYLESIHELDTDGLDISYYFLENGSEDNSLELLRELTADWPQCVVDHVDNYLPTFKRFEPIGDPCYVRMAMIREQIRKYAVDGGFDYLFSVDSDIMLQPRTLKALLAHTLHFVASLISNSGTAAFIGVNAAKFNPARGPEGYQQPPYWSQWFQEGKEVRECGGTGAVFLASREILQAATYNYRVHVGSPYWVPLGRDGQIFGEDFQFAMSCGEAGYSQYIDEAIRQWHCYTPKMLDIYRQARKRYHQAAVKLLTDRAHAGIVDDILVPGIKPPVPPARPLYS